MTVLEDVAFIMNRVEGRMCSGEVGREAEAVYNTVAEYRRRSQASILTSAVQSTVTCSGGTDTLSCPPGQKIKSKKKRRRAVLVVKSSHRQARSPDEVRLMDFCGHGWGRTRRAGRRVHSSPSCSFRHGAKWEKVDGEKPLFCLEDSRRRAPTTVQAEEGAGGFDDACFADVRLLALPPLLDH